MNEHDNFSDNNMSPSSMKAINTNESVMNDIKAQVETIPSYLGKENKLLLDFIHQISSSMPIVGQKSKNETEIRTKELRKMMILIHKIMMIQTFQFLWTIYLKSGTGQLIIASKDQQSSVYPMTVSLWPKELRTILPCVILQDINENEFYSNFVNHQLHELHSYLKQYQSELNIEANQFHGYTLTVQKRIETYLEQHLSSFRLAIEHQVELIHYDCQIRALKEAYLRQKPSDYHVCFVYIY